MSISKMSKIKIPRNLWDDTSLSLIILRMCTILLVTFWLSSLNPATLVQPYRCASNLSENGSIDSEPIYPWSQCYGLKMSLLTLPSAVLHFFSFFFITWINVHLLSVSWTLRNKLQWNLNQNTKLFIQENASENVIHKTVTICPWSDELKQGQSNIPSWTPYIPQFASLNSGSTQESSITRPIHKHKHKLGE